jgi:hypothetical protein
MICLDILTSVPLRMAQIALMLPKSDDDKWFLRAAGTGYVQRTKPLSTRTATELISICATRQNELDASTAHRVARIKEGDDPNTLPKKV